MKKICISFFGMMLLSMVLAYPSFAGQWKQDNNGWWYENTDGSWPMNMWQWIDSNNDGVAECYFFDSHGYCLSNCKTPDGFFVDSRGAWVIDGVIQTRNVSSNTNGSRISQNDSITGTYTGYYTASQGKTGVTIDIYEDMGEYWGEYYFYNLDGYSNAKEGAYHIRIIGKGSNKYKIEADSWIDQPSGYSMLSWNDVLIQNGKISATNGSYILRCEKND